MFSNVCSISGLTEQNKIRKQLIRDIVAKEEPDIMGIIETNLLEEEISMKGIGDYRQYQTRADKNKGVMMVVKEEMHLMIKDKLDNGAIAITIYEGAITIMTVYVTYKEDIKEVRQWIAKNLPQNQGFIIMGDFNNFQKEIEKVITAQWKLPIVSRQGARKIK